MRVIRLYVDQSLALDNDLKLVDEARHHAINVLRVNKNSALNLFNGDGYDYICEVLSLKKKAIVVKVVDKISIKNESPLTVNLVLGVSKSSQMDYAIQKTVEAGVTNIYPVITQRTITKLSDKTIINKHQHWQRIIIHACEQCGRASLPKLHSIINLSDLNRLENHQQGFVFEQGANLTLAKFTQDSLSSVWLLVGPEGGLTGVEVEEVEQKGFHAVSLGARVLRTETAALSAVITSQIYWGDMSASQI